MTVGVGAQGLTLTRANTVYLMEPCVHVADEAQAMNRVHRIGQTRRARCVVLFAEGTVEERLLRMRRASRVGQMSTAVQDEDDLEDPDTLAVIPVAAAASGPPTAAGDDLPLHNLDQLIGFPRL